MTKSMFRLGYTLLISGIMVAATEPSSSAGTKIQVTFSGSGFNGCFQYDQSQPKEAPHVFNFTGSGLSVCPTSGFMPPYDSGTRHPFLSQAG